MIDSCGSAGGRLPGQGGGGYGAGYVNTTHSKIGDLGSKTLPVHDTGTVWAAGKQYEVAWTIQAVSNHHGPMERCLPFAHPCWAHGRAEPRRGILLPPLPAELP